MTVAAILAALLAVVALLLYLRNRRIIAELRDANLRYGSIIARSLKRRAALVRVARFARGLDLTLTESIASVVRLGQQVRERDAAIEKMRTPFGMVREFHAKVGQPDAPAPDISQHRELRIRLIDEEFRELRDALEANDIVEVADALADLLYVVIGSGLQWGIPLEHVFAEVHRSNMTKERGLKRADGKILKGPNYSPPDVAGALRMTGNGNGQHVAEPAEPAPIQPTAANCKLLGAERCNHDRMTAEETQAVFGEGAKG